MSQYGLGRGLDALIARKKVSPSLSTATKQSEVAEKQEAIWEIPVDIIDANEYQPRQQFDKEQLSELADSIREYGIIQPLVARRSDNRYTLIAGERRLRAARLVGLKVVPVVLRDSNEHERLAVALIENIQRVDLNPIELAFSYKRLLDEFNLTQDEVATRVGKSRPAVTNTIRLLNLPHEIQEALQGGRINYTVARTILSIPNVQDQIQFYRDLLETGATSDQIERAAREISKKPHTVRFNTSPDIANKEMILREHFGTRVTIKKGRGRAGSLTIDFYSDDELNAIMNKIIYS